MRTNLCLFLTAFLCSVGSFLAAQPVNINTAKAIAERHLATISKSSLKSTASKGKNFQFTSVKATVENNDTLYYILNDTINKGFIIVSADKRAWPILAYSTEGSLNEKKQPDAFVAWMEKRKKEIESIKLNNLQPDSATTASWQNLNLKNSTIEDTSVEPLIQTQWDQGCYYNSMCPTDAQSPYCGHVPTGCTITAMAQIMKYWNYPTKGTGSYSYSHPTYGNLSADFGSTIYQWNQMPNNVTSQNDAVATLMYHCGVSLETDYSTGASAAFDPRDALIQYFNYSSNVMVINRNGFTTSEWINILKSELHLHHPIWYSGSGSVGHSFICDGYKDAGYFHFNWGWSGLCDGYFYIDNLNPLDNYLGENQLALIHIIPGSLPIGYNGFFLTSNALDVNVKGGTATVDVCSSINWTASSNQEWLSLNTNAGVSGKTTLILTATENQSGKDRSATVTISAPGFVNQLITVSQFTPINVLPGGLYDLISKKATSITKLTLSGTIDARDFKTMRDAMPALTDIDLSDVTIVTYTGAQGTVNQSRTYPANEIPDDAFYIIPCQGQNLLKSIILPETITSIGSYAFGNSKYLPTINIPASVTKLGVLAFQSCSALINVDTNNPKYSSIEGVLFNKDQTAIIQCPISKSGNYSIPSSVTSIEGRAFDGCIKLKTVTIPSSVTSIGSYAFIDCSGLTAVSIPSSVMSIESEAFRNCSALINVDENSLNYSSIDGVLFNKTHTKLIQCPTSKTGTYTIPSSITSLGRFSFSDCIHLTSVIIPLSLTTIEICAFNACSGLTNVAIPSSVISIGYAAFNCCSGLKSINIPSSVISIESTAFSDCSKLSSIYVYSVSPINLNASADVFYGIDKNACILYVPYDSKASFQSSDQWKDFNNIVEMPGIFISDHTLGMDSNAGNAQITISSASNWTAVSNQPWLTVSPANGSAGSNTIIFSATENPTKAIRTAMVNISATGVASQVITITQYGRVEVTAGNLKTILAGQLSSITSLTLIGIIDARDFKTMRDEMPALTNINLSEVKIAAYTGLEGTEGAYNISYPADCIPNSAFCNQNITKAKNTLNSIIISSSVTSIGNSAFKDCEGLASINIPSSLISIGNYAFENCKRISAINIPSAVNSIGRGAFIFFYGSINVDINNSKYSSIEGILFNKTQTELIQVPMSKTGSYNIPSSVTSIGDYAFMFCSGLTNISIPSSVTSIREGAFSHCIGLTSMNVPLSVTSIETYTFSECNKLMSISFPSSIVSIGNWASSGCTQLTSIYIYKSAPPNLDNSIDVFSLVSKTSCILHVPYGSKAYYSVASQWKDFRNIVEMPGIFLSENSIIMDSKAGTAQTSISSSSNWTATSDQTWLTINPSNGTAGSTTITFTATANTSEAIHTATVVISANGFEPQMIKITQKTENTNKAPVANAGTDQTVDEGSTVTLDGSLSFDSDGNSLSYKWTSPEGISLSSTTVSKPTFIAPEVIKDTPYIFSLLVNDGYVDSPVIDQVLVIMKQVDKAPYVRDSIKNICVNKRSPDQIINLKNVFADDDLDDILSYIVISNSNDQVVTARITGSDLILSFSTKNIGTSQLEVIVSSNGKEAQAKFKVEVDSPTVIGTNIIDNLLEIYPNPTSGKVKLTFDKIPKEGIQLFVTDFAGKIILQQFIQENEVLVDLSGNAPGIYFIKTDQENLKTQKVILE
jgi:hypothetical protein